MLASTGTAAAGLPRGVGLVDDGELANLTDVLVARAASGLHGGVILVGSVGSSLQTAAFAPYDGILAGIATQLASHGDPSTVRHDKPVRASAWAVRSDAITDLLAHRPVEAGPAPLVSPPSDRPFVWPNTAGLRPAMRADGSLIPGEAPVAVDRVAVARLRAVACRSGDDAYTIVTRISEEVQRLRAPARRSHSAAERDAYASPTTTGVHVFFRLHHASGGSVTLAVTASQGHGRGVENLAVHQSRARHLDGAAGNRDGLALTRTLGTLAVLGDARRRHGDAILRDGTAFVPDGSGRLRRLRVPFRDSRLLRCMQSLLDSDCRTFVAGFADGESEAANSIVIKQLGFAARIVVAYPDMPEAGPEPAAAEPAMWTLGSSAVDTGGSPSSRPAHGIAWQDLEDDAASDVTRDWAQPHNPWRSRDTPPGGAPSSPGKHPIGSQAKVHTEVSVGRRGGSAAGSAAVHVEEARAALAEAVRLTTLASAAVAASGRESGISREWGRVLSSVIDAARPAELMLEAVIASPMQAPPSASDAGAQEDELDGDSVAADVASIASAAASPPSGSAASQHRGELQHYRDDTHRVQDTGDSHWPRASAGEQVGGARTPGAVVSPVAAWFSHGVTRGPMQ